MLGMDLAVARIREPCSLRTHPDLRRLRRRRHHRHRPPEDRHGAHCRHDIPAEVRTTSRTASVRATACRPSALQQLPARAQLVISVDTGIRAFAAAREARAPGSRPHRYRPSSARSTPREFRALAVLNPNQPGCPYPFKDLCGAAVAFKLAQALLCKPPPQSRSRPPPRKDLPFLPQTSRHRHHRRLGPPRWRKPRHRSARPHRAA